MQDSTSIQQSIKTSIVSEKNTFFYNTQQIVFLGNRKYRMLEAEIQMECLFTMNLLESDGGLLCKCDYDFRKCIGYIRLEAEHEQEDIFATIDFKHISILVGSIYPTHLFYTPPVVDKSGLVIKKGVIELKNQTI